MEVATFQKINNCGLFWCIVFFIVVRTSVFAFNCSEVNGCICRPAKSDPSYNIICEPQNYILFDITIYDSNQPIQITCTNSPKWADFHLKLRPLENNALTFKGCDLPPNTISLSKITQMLGVTDLKSLQFTHFTNLNIKIKYPYSVSDSLKEFIIYDSISSGYKDMLANLTNLTTLNLEHNYISIIPAELFKHTPKLEILVLNNNRLESIKHGTFDNLKFLKQLGISNNKLFEFPSAIYGQLIALEILNLSNNELASLPENIFEKMENLTYINLGSNLFEELPRHLLRNNTKLQTFDISFNIADMMTLSREFFNNLTDLKELMLNWADIVTLPEDIFWGSFSLAKINLTQNRLKYLPQNIFRDAEQLISLEIGRNELEKLPEYIFNNTNRLEKLILSNNRLRFISKNTFGKLNQLRELNLEGNNLTTISISQSHSMPGLTITRFSNNNLTSQFFTSFCLQCNNLQELYLDHNNISETLSLEIVGYPHLHVLDLRYNKISVLNLTYLGNRSNNIEIYLAHNTIKHIHLIENELVRQFQEKEYNVNISVNNNPVICDCSLYDFLRYIEGRMHQLINNFLHIIPTNLYCHSPKWLENVKVTNLRSKTLVCRAKEANLNIPCPRECDCILRPEDKEWRIDCSGKNLIHVPSDVKDPGKPYKLGLIFSKNILKKMPNLAELNLQSTRLLDLSYNNISEVSQDGLPDVIEVLKLHNNNISRIPSDVLEFLKNSTNLTKLTLHGNPWECDCEAKDFLNFVHTKHVKIHNLSEVMCHGKNYSISRMTIEDFCPGETELFIISIVIPVVLIAIGGIIIGVFGFYQRNIKVWLFAHQWCLWFVKEEELDKEKLYDAFISYSHKDEDFVVNELVPTLESGPKPYKLCLHFRDWIPGELIPMQIIKSVEDSRRTIIVLSRNFLESVWGRMEFQTAHSQALSEGRARIIPILYSDIGSTDTMDSELKAYISMNTYIKWGDPRFWDKLRYALPHTSRFVNANVQRAFENCELTQSNKTSI